MGRSNLDDLLSAYDQQQEEAASGPDYSAPLAPQALPTEDIITGSALGILPLLIGGLIKGREGLNAGAKAGLLGVNEFKQQLEEDSKHRQQLELQRRKGIQEISKSKLGLLGNLLRDKENQSNIYDRREREKENGILGAGKNSELNLSEGDINQFADTLGLKPEEAASLLRIQKAVPGIAGTLNSTGTNRRLASEKTLDAITKSENFTSTIKDLKDLANQMEKEDFGNLKRAFASGEVTKYIKDPSSAAYKFYAKLNYAQKTLAGILEPGRLTDKDYDVLTPLVRGSPVYDSPKDIQDRLVQLEALGTKARNNILNVVNAGRRNVGELQSLPVPIRAVKYRLPDGGIGAGTEYDDGTIRDTSGNILGTR